MSPDFGHLNIAATVDDPKAYTRPWIVRLQQQIVAAKWQTPIIFVTSHADDDARLRALAAGAVAYLYKPFHEKELLNAIDAALKRSSGDEFDRSLRSGSQGDKP